MTGSDNEEGFLSRWSKRKGAARESSDEEDNADGLETAAIGNDGDEPAIDGSSGEEMLDASDFDDVDFDKLDESSDYTRFIKANVPASIQQQALRKLWTSDPVFEVLDGMNDYDEDFTGTGLAGKVLKTAHKIGRGFVDDEDVITDTTENPVQVDREGAGETPDSIEAEMQIDDENLSEETAETPGDETNDPV